MKDGKGALSGIRIVDLTRILAGPFCTQMLGDHGAEIVKIEALEGDETRRWGPPFSEDGMSAYFLGVNRNKRSIAINLATQVGREILCNLLMKADVLIENFKSGQMQKWGLDYETIIRKKFPTLIYGQITGYGSNGPLSGRPGFDAIAQVMSGLASINGTSDGPPVRVGTPISDLATALYVTNAILMALYERASSGLGQKVEVSLLDSSISLLHPHAANFLMTGVPPTRMGNAHPNIAPYEMFRTANGYIFIAGGSDKQFTQLVTLLGKPELAIDSRFINNASRKANEHSLTDELSALLAHHDAVVLAEKLLAEGVPAGAVVDIPQVLAHPQVQAREMVVKRGNYQGLGVPVKMSRTPGRVRSLPPRLGEHAEDILLEAGYDYDQIRQFTEQKVVGSSKYSVES